MENDNRENHHVFLNINKEINKIKKTTFEIKNIFLIKFFRLIKKNINPITSKIRL